MPFDNLTKNQNKFINLFKKHFADLANLPAQNYKFLPHSEHNPFSAEDVLIVSDENEKEHYIKLAYIDPSMFAVKDVASNFIQGRLLVRKHNNNKIFVSEDEDFMPYLMYSSNAVESNNINEPFEYNYIGEDAKLDVDSSIRRTYENKLKDNVDVSSGNAKGYMQHGVVKFNHFDTLIGEQIAEAQDLEDFLSNPWKLPYFKQSSTSNKTTDDVNNNYIAYIDLLY